MNPINAEQRADLELAAKYIASDEGDVALTSTDACRIANLLTDLAASVAQHPQAEAVPADQSKWCAYVADLVGSYLGERVGGPKVAAIAGIIERRMWALPKPANDRAERYAIEINHLRNVIQAACLGGTEAMLDRWKQLFPDAPVPTVKQAGAVPASCGECGKKTSDGWALYCVACMEKAGLPAVTGSPPLTHSCTSSLVRTVDFTAQAVPLTQAARDVLAERQRQVSVEGWTPKHDDEHSDGSMALAAACYACNAATWAERAPRLRPEDYVRLAFQGFRWPWAAKWWKPKSQRQDLLKAAALILAEIERYDRATQKEPGHGLAT